MRDGARHVQDTYYGNGNRREPLGAYVVLNLVYLALVAVGTALIARRRGSASGRPRLADLVLVAGATHRVARDISKDRVTAYLRVPFTRRRGRGEPGEVNDAARGAGLQRAVGELVTCPYCLDQWVGTAFVAGLATRPQLTRWIAAIFVVPSVANVMQALYVRFLHARKHS